MRVREHGCEAPNQKLTLARFARIRAAIAATFTVAVFATTAFSRPSTDVTLSASGRSEAIAVPAGASVKISLKDAHSVTSRKITVSGTCVSYRSVCKGLNFFGFCVGWTKQEADTSDYRSSQPREEKAKPFEFLSVQVQFTTRHGSRRIDRMNDPTDVYIAPEPGHFVVSGLLPAEGHFTGKSNQPGLPGDNSTAVAEVDAGCSAQGKQRKGAAVATYDSSPNSNIGTWKAIVTITPLKR